ncbi:MAG: (E)-4-hydroxy-3-methylbut-2-enyl-diphosphate synthase [Treponema sp.]|jgi:(E)-4-hydroxy-3-methylbut-2-enyl-diphosphate synthase|nr:(E)-4-hydroxy-3-methylbut-2-enyl-diphosphate synthase [Treponema sp.]
MKTIHIGGFDHVRAVTLGGDSPVAVQTMWKDRLSFSDLGDELVRRIEGLGSMGCDLLRFAVPNLAAAEPLGALAKMVSMPLAADIHFDYKIALRCMDFPIAKIRINPGNIGGKDKVRAVLDKAAEKNIPIRIGVNAGSLPQDLRTQDLRERVGLGSDRALALVEAALRELAVFDEFGFTNAVVSMKASNLADTIQANRLLAQRTDAPLHIGVTEAGPLVAGVARSSAALAVLLAQGIGDTLRVSLSDSVENEVIAAREICAAAAEIAAIGNPAADGVTAAGGLTAENRSARLKRPGVTVISCPRCGRHSFDTHGFCSRWLNRLYALDRTITIADMGCEVNGPEEARHADIGITGAGGKALIFRRGKIVRTVTAEEADAAFAEELGSGIGDWGPGFSSAI